MDRAEEALLKVLVETHPKIVQFPSKTLFKKSRDVLEITPQIKSFADKMAKIVVNLKAAGLSAIQLGVPLNMFIGIDENEVFQTMVNPKIHGFLIKAPESLVEAARGWTGDLANQVLPEWLDAAAASRMGVDIRPVPMVEGCLSLTGQFATVERFEGVDAEWTDLTSQPHRAILKGLAAQVFQHEWEHCNGGFFLDHKI